MARTVAFAQQEEAEKKEPPVHWLRVRQHFSAGELAWLDTVTASRDMALASSEHKQRLHKADILRQTATQSLEWAVLRRWERDCEFDSFLFGCDRKHVCWNEEGAIETINASLCLFGCRVCRRAHVCRRQWDDCIKALTYEGEYVCAFSGLVVETEMAIGTYDGERRMISLQNEQSINFGGDTLEGMKSQGKIMAASIADARNWMRQGTRQKRRRDEEAATEADAEFLSLMNAMSNKGTADRRQSAAKRSRTTTTTTKIMSETASAANKRVDTNVGYPDDHDAAFPEMQIDDDALLYEGNDDDDDGNGDMVDDSMDDTDGDDAMLDNNDNDGVSARMEAGDYDASYADRDAGGGETRMTTANARLSGTSVAAWNRNTKRLMEQDHNLTPLDATHVSASFLQNVTLELNIHDAMERALHAFDNEYSDELTLEKHFGVDAVAADDGAGSANEQSTTRADTSGEDSMSGSVSSVTEVAPTSSEMVDRPLNSQRAYRRALQKVRHTIELDIRAIVHVFSDDTDGMATKNDRGTEYVNFAMRLFRILMRVNGQNTPARLGHIGIVLMLELLTDHFVIVDNVAGRGYPFLIWNADAWLASLKKDNMFDLLLIEDARRNKQESRRSAARLNQPAKLDRIKRFRAQHGLTRAQLTLWVATTRKMLIQAASASPQAFHAALFSCPVQ